MDKFTIEEKNVQPTGWTLSQIFLEIVSGIYISTRYANPTAPGPA